MFWRRPRAGKRPSEDGRYVTAKAIAAEVVGWREEGALTWGYWIRRAGRVGLGDLKKEEEGFAGWGTSEIVVLNPPVGGKAPG